MFDHEMREAAEHVLFACRKRKLKVVTAESCTGGLIAAALTAIAGSSDVVDRGFVTYSNEAKREMLGVPWDAILGHGAVSEPVARAMAAGALAHSGADIAVSVTGVAGPAAARTKSPSGWSISAPCATGFEPIAERHVFPGDRDAIRRAHGRLPRSRCWRQLARAVGSGVTRRTACRRAARRAPRRPRPCAGRPRRTAAAPSAAAAASGTRTRARSRSACRRDAGWKIQRLVSSRNGPSIPVVSMRGPVGIVGRQLDARDELLVERAEADRQFGDLDVRPFALADAAGRAPGQELRIARHVGHEIEELPRREGHDPPLGVTGDANERVRP